MHKKGCTREAEEEEEDAVEKKRSQKGKQDGTADTQDRATKFRQNKLSQNSKYLTLTCGGQGPNLNHERAMA